MTVHEATWAEVQAAFPEDRFLVHDAGIGGVLRAGLTPTTWSFRARSDYWSADWVTVWSGASDPSDIERDVNAHISWHLSAADGGFVKGVTVNAQVPVVVSGTVEAANDWSWFWVDSEHFVEVTARADAAADVAAPAHVEANAEATANREPASRVVEVEHHDPRLIELLTHSPTASHERGGVAPTAWFGIFEGEQLLSVAAVKQQERCVSIQSVVTHSQARGRGLSTLVCRYATAWGLQRNSVVALGMMTDNVVAERMYTRLGYVCEKRWQSIRFSTS